MIDATRIWSVFTKPWRDLPAPELADLVVRMGFNAIEFPLRPGFQVDLDHLGPSLGQLVQVMADRGVSVASVASATSPEIFEACAEQGIPLIRIMVPVAPQGYLHTGDHIRRQLDDLVPLASKHGVTIGIQPHCNDYIADSSELATLLKEFEADSLTAIWDAAHDGLAGKHPSNALALLWDRLAMVNFKNACYRAAAPAADGAPPWRITFVEGPDGLTSWTEAATCLAEGRYAGPICLPAEYTDGTDLEQKVTRDLRYLRGLLDGAAA